jgi:hypothetical protein
MGIYDTYGDVQLKVGLPTLDYYILGDFAPIPDGVYIAPDGIVVIHKGVFIAEYKEAIDKWGRYVPVENIFFT